MKLQSLAMGVALCAVSCGGRAVFDPIPLPCATASIPASTPPLSFADSFAVDTGLAPYEAIGATYGQPACPNQLLLDVELTGSAIAGKSFFLFGGWSTAIATDKDCSDFTAQMTTYGRTPGSSTFGVWDTVNAEGSLQGALCNSTTTHTNPSDEGLGGALIPAGVFAELRIAASAAQDGVKVPVLVSGVVAP